MVNKKVVKYFNNLIGKNLEESEIKNESNNNSSNANLLLNAINTAYNDKNPKGSYKYCCFFGEQEVFALLKSKKVANACDLQFFKRRSKNVIALNRSIIKEGGAVPKLYSIFFADKKYCEIQERFLGTPIYASYINQISEKLLHRQIDFKGKIAKQDTEKIGNYIFNYNLEKQKTMMNLPQSAYDKLFNTFILLNKMGLSLGDNHCGNVLVNEQGFNLIDIDYKELYFKKLLKQDLNHQNIDETTRLNDMLLNYLYPFKYSTLFDRFLQGEQIEELRQNDKIIYGKLFESVKKAGISPKQFKNSDVKTCYLDYACSINQFCDAMDSKETKLKDVSFISTSQNMKK